MQRRRSASKQSVASTPTRSADWGWVFCNFYSFCHFSYPCSICLYNRHIFGNWRDLLLTINRNSLQSPFHATQGSLSKTRTTCHRPAVLIWCVALYFTPNCNSLGHQLKASSLLSGSDRCSWSNLNYINAQSQKNEQNPVLTLAWSVAGEISGVLTTWPRVFKQHFENVEMLQQRRKTHARV